MNNSLERCNEKNPLMRDGTSQTQRFTKVLDPSYFLVDERDTADLIEFCRRYAKRIQYWNISNEKEQDWSDFIVNTEVSFVSSLLKSTFDSNRPAYEQLLVNLKGTELEPIPTLTAGNLKPVIVFLTDVARGLIDLQNQATTKGFDGIGADIDAIIESQAAFALRRLIAYDKKADILLDGGTSFYSDQDYLEFVYDMNVSGSSVWEIQDLTDIVALEDEVFGLPGATTDTDRILLSLKELNNVFEAFYTTYEHLKVAAEKRLNELLTNYSEHEPHVGLLLGFIQMFKQGQDSLNQFTKRHLDFFYKDVLQLEFKDSVPDRVYLVLDLAKNVSSYLLKKGTAFSAEKDNIGALIKFELEENVALNNAKVVSLKTIHIQKNQDTNAINIFKAPVANSEDGNGEPFSDGERWKLFGRASNQIMLDEAEVGFAIGSPQLFLQEGVRTIDITLKLQGPIGGSTITGLSSLIKVQLSGEEGWIEPGVTVNPISATSATPEFKLQIVLQADVGKVVRYNKEIHGGNVSSKWPVFKMILLKPVDDESNYSYELLKNLKLATQNQVKIKVNVVGVTNLLLQNDETRLSNNKPVFPFGSIPGPGSNFYIGSEEVFSKKLSNLKVILNWMDPPENMQEHYKAYPLKFRKIRGQKDLNQNFVIYRRDLNYFKESITTTNEIFSGS